MVDPCSLMYAVGDFLGSELRDSLIMAGAGKVFKLVGKLRSPCKNSFAEGTPVETPDGPKPIEDLEPGDLVLARNDQTGEIDWRPIGAVIHSDDKPVLELELISEAGREPIKTTPDHPFWVTDRGWVEAKDLAPGDPLVSANGGWLRVGAATWLQETAPVYNFEVPGFHTYFVGESAAWTHNCAWQPGQSKSLADQAADLSDPLVSRA
jgi:hypothetical protein